MKKIITVIAVTAMLFSGCARNGAAPETETEKNIPERRAAELTDEAPAEAETVLAEVSTPLLDDSASRVENINIACGAINGVVLLSGGSFSFNDTVGRRSEENGYGDAPVLVNGHKEQGCGGGVCQVSSTLYMAALDAGMTIDERHKHSESVAYAPDGNDATVVFGEKDLCFTNGLAAPVTLYIWTDGASVFSKITQKTLDNNS